MKVFVDTSAFYALACTSDQFHLEAKAILERLISTDQELVTSNYILVETCGLILNRLGFSAVKTFLEVSLSSISIQWVTQQIHEKAVHKLIQLGKKNLSLVDCTSFILMKTESIRQAFTFDTDFEKEELEIVHNDKE